MKINFRTIAALMILLTQCTNDPAKTTEDGQAPASGNANVVTLTTAQIKNTEIVIGEPSVKKVNSTIRLNGVVDVKPGNKVYVSNAFGGFVKSTSILPGTRVKKGDLLATMEDPQYIQLQQDYLMALSRLQFLELDFSRQQDLNSDKSISDKSFQQVRSDYASQKILVSSLAEKLRLININPEVLNENTISRIVNVYAPITGYVSAVGASVGKYSNPTEALFELTDERSLHASLTIFEKDFPFVAVGQTVMIKSPSRPREEFPAIVRLINRSLTTERSSELHCEFLTPATGLFPGMFVSGELAINEAEALVVPEGAVVSSQNKQYIFMVNDNDNFEMTLVETGMNSDGFVELKNADLTGKRIVTKNAYSLLMKLKSDEE